MEEGKQKGENMESTEKGMQDVILTVNDTKTSATLDNVSNWSSEETQSDPFSDELLRLDGRGIKGLLERIPMTIKLVIMCSVSLIGLLILTGLLIAVTSQNIQAAKSANTFNTIATDIGQAIQKIQNERSATGEYLAASVNATQVQLDNMKQSFQITDNYIHFLNKVFAKYFDGEIAGRYIDEYYLYENNLTIVRNAALMNATTGTETFTFYSNLIQALINCLARFVVQAGGGIYTNSLLGLIRIYELEEQIRSLGQIIMTSRILTPTAYKEFATYIGERDFAVNNWKAINPISIVNFYDDAVDGVSINGTGVIEDYIIMNRQFLNDTYLPEFSLQEWDANTTTMIDKLGSVWEYVVSDMMNYSSEELGKASGMIIGSILVIALSLVASLIISIIFSCTIVGPWRRLNKIQEIAINKFVPQEFLRLLGFKKIGDVELGVNVQKNLTMLNVGIRHFNRLTSDMKPSEVLDFVNQYYNYISPIIRKHRGFIHDYNANNIVALFIQAQKGIKAMVDVQNATHSYNSRLSERKLPSIDISVSVQSDEMVIGTVGENERMEGCIISNHEDIGKSLYKICKKFDLNMITTKAAITNSQKPFKHITFRSLGRMLIDDSNGEENMMEVCEVLKLSDSSNLVLKEKFEDALLLFYRGIYMEAFQRFSEIIKEFPKDVITYKYLKATQALLNQVRYFSSNLGIKTVLRNNILFEAFEIFCQKEMSTENIRLWSEIESFKNIESIEERKIHAKRLRKEYLSINGRYTINIDQHLKDNVAQKLNDDSNDLHSIFNPIQFELEIIMSDTFKRFKESAEFFEGLNSSEFRIPQPTIDQL